MEKSDLGRESIMNISLICFTRDGFETMKRINDTLSELLKLSRMRPCPNIVIGAQRPRTDPVRGYSV